MDTDDPHVTDSTIAVLHIYVDHVEGVGLRRRMPVTLTAPGAELTIAEVLVDLAMDLEQMSDDEDAAEDLDAEDWAELAMTVAEA